MPESAEQDSEPASQSDSSPAASGKSRRTSDRALGFLCLALAIWFILETRNFVVTSFGSGPVGPKTLPTLVGIVFAGLAVVLIFKPGESPKWGSLAVGARLGAIVVVSFLFGQLLEPIGFIIASTMLAVVIGLFFNGSIIKLVPLAFVFATVVAFIFNNWLELRLPAGWWGGL